MPRGIPKAGKRATGGGRKKKYGCETVQRWTPTVIADKLDDLYLFLIELDSEINQWESICESKKTSPRYEQARKLTATIRERIDGLGIDLDAIYASEQD
ncbi:hypothetical protein VB711_22150 [Cronbergia sp. UHCC 0137]|uniref:hypothetical protein n=1 Tax=Cronbergia sp. UHCC 0137 TaxID=3110239 RepID=UPI002B200FAC|nr:hypothetical protein [Cronbergia sp. UHCC 0137]MEA5620520.1 hypothetical protein [Cronbergia sp. UHCC 0137]